MSPVGVPEEEIPGRVPEFLERAGYYFQNWPTLEENWHTKIRGVIDELEAIRFEPLPDRVPLTDITSGKGLDPHLAFTHSYNRLIELAYTAFQYHFEFLNLGYVAYLDFFGFCQEAFPGISDLGIAKMVQGIEVDLFRPDDELKQLARLAISRDIDVEAGLEAVTDEVWLAAWEAAKDPWFNFSSGSGMYSSDKVWLDHLAIPFGFLRDYVRDLRAGKDIARPTEAIRAERDRVTSEYRALLPADAQAVFDEKLGLSRLVFPYVENHNFYIEHWSLSVFWRRVRELGQVLADAGFWADAEDIFMLRRDEIPQAIFDYGNGWAVGAECAGPYHWPGEIERRKGLLAALGAKPPLPAMNEPPAVITEPFTIMLYGITSERVGQWLSGGEEDGGLRGMAASPGLIEGVARVVLDADDLAAIQPGEILVSRITAPSWGPVFGQIAAVVTDIGGMMSHAAIVCREYGLPAVTGTGSATTAIVTGQRIRVDGDGGTVTVVA
jgi:pyruvate,water dikinase